MRESVSDYLARGGQIEHGPYLPCFGEGNRVHTQFKFRGTAAGLRAQLERGCPSCGGPVQHVQAGSSPAIIECGRCGDRFRAATGEAV